MSISISKIQQLVLYLVVFLLPWQARYIFYDPTIAGEVWEYGRLSLYGWDIVLLILIIWLWPRLRQEFKVAFNQNRAFYFYVLLVSLTFLTSAWAIKPLLVIYWGVRLLEGGVFWLLVKILKPKLHLLMLSLALAGVIQAGWGFGQFVSQDITANKWLGVAAHPVTQAGTSVLLNEGGRWLRAYGGQAHPNILGGLLVVTLLATGWLMINSKAGAKKSTILLVVIYTFQLMGLFLTFSRAAWLALFVSLMVSWFTWQDKRRELVVMFSITGIVFLVLGLVLWAPTKTRLWAVSTSHLEQQAIEERLTGFKESQNLLIRAWWRGVGLGNYTAALVQNEPGLRAYHYQPVHNIFLLIFTELGLVGFIIWLLFLWQRFKVYPRSLVVFIVPLAVTLFFDHYWWTQASMMLIFWLILAIPEISTHDS